MIKITAVKLQLLQDNFSWQQTMSSAIKWISLKTRRYGATKTCTKTRRHTDTQNDQSHNLLQCSLGREKIQVKNRIWASTSISPYPNCTDLDPPSCGLTLDLLIPSNLGLKLYALYSRAFLHWHVTLSTLEILHVVKDLTCVINLVYW